MLRFGRGCLHLLEVAGQLRDGDAAFLKAAATAARALLSTGAILLVTGQQLRNCQLFLVSHVSFLFQSLIGTAQNDTFTESPGADL